MRIISVRIDDKLAKQYEELLAYIGCTGENESELLRAFIQRLHDKLLMAKNSQAASDALGKHETTPIDTSCSLRIRTEVTAKGKTQEFFYCLFFKPNTPVRQIKLVSPAVCEVCCLIREQRMREPIKEIEPPISDVTEQGAVIAQPIYSEPTPKKTKWTPPTKEHLQKAFSYNKDGSKNCPFSYNPVWLTECAKCGDADPDKAAECKTLFRALKQPKN